MRRKLCSPNVLLVALYIVLAWIFVYCRYNSTVLNVITTNTLLYYIIMNYLPGVTLNVPHFKNVWIKAVCPDEIWVLCHILFFWAVWKKNVKFSCNFIEHTKSLLVWPLECNTEGMEERKKEFCTCVQHLPSSLLAWHNITTTCSYALVILYVREWAENTQ